MRKWNNIAAGKCLYLYILSLKVGEVQKPAFCSGKLETYFSNPLVITPTILGCKTVQYNNSFYLKKKRFAMSLHFSPHKTNIQLLSYHLKLPNLTEHESFPGCILRQTCCQFFWKWIMSLCTNCHVVLGPNCWLSFSFGTKNQYFARIFQSFLYDKFLVRQ